MEKMGIEAACEHPLQIHELCLYSYSQETRDLQIRLQHLVSPHPIQLVSDLEDRSVAEPGILLAEFEAVLELHFPC